MIIGPFNDLPGCLAGVGPRHGNLGRLQETVVHLVVGPVDLGNPPAVQRVILQGLQALFLCFSTHVHPELQDQRAIIRQGLLEGPDSPQTLQVGIQVGIAVDIIQQWPRIATAEVDADGAPRRQVAPELPPVGALQFLARGIAVGVRLDITGIHPLVKQVGGGAFAAATHAAEIDQHRKAAIGAYLCLQVEQGLAQDLFAFLECLFGYGLAEFRRLEHGRIHAVAQKRLR